MATTTFRGTVAATDGFTGDLTGDITGDVTGTLNGTAVLTSYTVSGLPAASTNTRRLVYVSNGDAGSPCLAVSNGTNWLRIALGTAVSAT